MSGIFDNTMGHHGYLDTGGSFTQIDVPGATETVASGINEAGQIVGVFRTARARTVSWLRQSPEPSTLSLLGIGLMYRTWNSAPPCDFARATLISKFLSFRSRLYNLAVPMIELRGLSPRTWGQFATLCRPRLPRSSAGAALPPGPGNTMPWTPVSVCASRRRSQWRRLPGLLARPSGRRSRRSGNLDRVPRGLVPRISLVPFRQSAHQRRHTKSARSMDLWHRRKAYKKQLCALRHQPPANAMDLFGHSAGGQFVHRMLSFGFRDRVAVAVSANAGTYAMPDLSTPWPFGLGETGRR